MRWNHSRRQAQHLTVVSAVDEGAQRLHTRPDRHVDDDPDAVGDVPLKRLHCGGVAVFCLQPPHETGGGVRLKR